MYGRFAPDRSADELTRTFNLAECVKYNHLLRKSFFAYQLLYRAMIRTRRPC